MHTTTDRAALLQAILADPDDDGARLVFADLLEDEGERDRATLIRDQIQKGWKLDATGGPCVWSIYGWAGFPRGDPSLACWRGANWFLSLDLPKEFRIARGFVEAITLPAADFLCHADELFTSHPITEVSLTTRPALERISSIPVMYRLPGRDDWRLYRYYNPAVTIHDLTRELLAAAFPRVRTWHLPGDTPE